MDRLSIAAPSPVHKARDPRHGVGRQWTEAGRWGPAAPPAAGKPRLGCRSFLQETTTNNENTAEGGCATHGATARALLPAHEPAVGR